MQQIQGEMFLPLEFKFDFIKLSRDLHIFRMFKHSDGMELKSDLYFRYLQAQDLVRKTVYGDKEVLAVNVVQDSVEFQNAFEDSS